MKLQEFIQKHKKERKTLNKRLMLEVARRLRNLKHEEHYNQATWVAGTICGTTCCIAGHTLLAAGLTPKQLMRVDDGDGTPDLARRLLGLTDAQADRLFSADTSEWPEEYAARFMNTSPWGDERPSRVAADLLEAIAQGRVEI